MSRPEHVRCENCCFWESWEIPGLVSDEEKDANMGGPGNCDRFPPDQPDEGLMRDYGGSQGKITAARQGCGEFRAEWPEESKGDDA